MTPIPSIGQGGSITLQSVLCPQHFTFTMRSEYSGQSYKHFTLVIFESRVVIWGIFKSGMTLES